MTERTAWMLHRLFLADIKLREDGEPEPEHENFWEPGAVWTRGNERHGVYLAAHWAGAAIADLAGREGLDRQIAEVTAEYGEAAGAWLRDRWECIQ